MTCLQTDSRKPGVLQSMTPQAILTPSSGAGLITQRNQRLRGAVFSSLMTKPLAVVIPLLTVPLFLKYLGTEGYGLFETITSLAGWLALTNLGLGMGLMNTLTGCYVSQDRSLARRHVSTVFVATAILVTLFGLALLGVIPFIEWNSVFRTKGPMSQWELTTAVGLAAALSLLAAFTAIVNPIYSAYQELTRFNYWDGAGKVLTVAGCYAIVYTAPPGLSPVLGALLVFLGVPAIVRLANLAYMFGLEKPWLRPCTKLFAWPLLKPMAAQGVCFLVLQTAGIISFQTDKLIISTTLGPTSVAQYAIVNRIFLIGYGVYMLLLTPIWPAYGEALRRGDLVWIKRNLRLTLWLGCGGMALLGVFLLWQGEAVLRLWIGGIADNGLLAGTLAIPTSIIVGMTLSSVLKAWVDSRSVILNAAGVLRGPIYFWTAQAVLNLALALVLVRFAGVLGVVWAGTISALLTTFWGYPLMMRKFLARHAASTNAGTDVREGAFPPAPTPPPL